MDLLHDCFRQSQFFHRLLHSVELALRASLSTLEERTLLLEMTRLGMVWSFLPGLPPLLVASLGVSHERPLVL
jgi:hypothetical protein